MIPTLEAMRETWQRIPVEGMEGSGYRYPSELLALSDATLRGIVEKAREARYSVRGWRNWGNGWRDGLGLDDTTGAHVLDYGCGAGVEAMEYARAGNTVTLSDINPPELAYRLFGVMGLPAPVEGDRFDVIHCCGVLHHIPDPDRVMKEFAAMLKPGGQVRLMLYSDRGWTEATGTPPPEDTQAHPLYRTFTRHFDRINEDGHTEWYDRAKVERFGWRVVDFRYITKTDAYLTARLEKP